MICYDCEHDPCICRELFPFARERKPDGCVYDHLGGLLVAPLDHGNPCTCHANARGCWVGDGTGDGEVRGTARLP